MTKKEYDNFKIGDIIWYYKGNTIASSVVKGKKNIKGSFGNVDVFIIGLIKENNLCCPCCCCFTTLKEAKIDRIVALKSFRDKRLYI